jgi:hypothetical protein
MLEAQSASSPGREHISLRQERWGPAPVAAGCAPSYRDRGRTSVRWVVWTFSAPRGFLKGSVRAARLERLGRAQVIP